MRHLAFLRGGSINLRAQGDQRGACGGSRFAGLKRPVASCGVLWTHAGGTCNPFKMVESGIPACMEAGMFRCLEVCQDWEALGMLH